MTQSGRVLAEYALDELPTGAVLHSVVAEPAVIDGRPSLRVALTEAVQLRGTPGVDYIDMPTYVELPVHFDVGILEVDIRSRLLASAPEYARGFAGLAFHITGGRDAFESVYVRPMNGRGLKPEPPRDRRAIQYFAYPDWKFDRLREAFPDGRFEAGADIEPDRWMRLRVECTATAVTAWIDDVQVLAVDEPLGSASTGHIGLWVDIGTEAYFANFTVRAPR